MTTGCAIAIACLGSGPFDQMDGSVKRGDGNPIGKVVKNNGIEELAAPVRYAAVLISAGHILPKLRRV